MQTCKAICAMTYGTPEQMKAADSWYTHFDYFVAGHPEFVSDTAWRAIHNTDVMYQARRRYLSDIHGGVCDLP